MKRIAVNNDLFVVCGTVLVEKVTTSTEELKKMYESSSYSRKKNIIKRELIKRNAFN